MRALRCIVVDDYAPNLLVIKTLLTLLGCEILTARSGEECLDILATTDVDVIFSDKNMPGMDGIELLRHVRESKDEIVKAMPFFIVTAEGRSALSRAEELDVSGWIDKPVSKASLARAVCEVDRALGVDFGDTPDSLCGSVVLCVDDDATCLQIVEHIVQSVDGVPVTMSNGEGALSRLASAWGSALGFPIDPDALITAAQTGDFSRDAIQGGARGETGVTAFAFTGRSETQPPLRARAAQGALPVPGQPPAAARRRSTRGVDTPDGEAASGEDALLLAAHPAIPRAIVLDINLPQVSGVAVARIIRAVEQEFHPVLPRMHIIIASGSVMESFNSDFMALIDGKINKPFRRVDVLHALVPLFRVISGEPSIESASRSPAVKSASRSSSIKSVSRSPAVKSASRSPSLPLEVPGAASARSDNVLPQHARQAARTLRHMQRPRPGEPMRLSRYASSQGSDTMGVVDFGVAASLDPDDLDFVAELVETFLGEARNQCAQLDAIADTPELDWTTIKRVAHQLAGTAGSVGMAKIGRLAATLEEHAKLVLGSDDVEEASYVRDPDTLVISAQCAVDLIKELIPITAESAAQWAAGKENGLLGEAAREVRED
jgi:two-component system chemotaxis response regulator CheY